MLCRAVLSALAISYLICVLWLSGLQKEDLDVNMLRKLQRHNVNIDDKNRDNLRNACLNTDKRKDIANAEKNITTDDDDNKASTLLLESESETNTKSDELESNKSAMLGTHNDEKQRSNERDTTIVKEKIEFMTSRIDNDSESDYLTEKTDSSIPKTIEKQVVTNDEQNLDNILKFWKMFTTPKSKERIVSVPKPKKTNKIISKKKMAKKSHNANVERSSKELEQINRLLADYFYKNEKPSTTQSTIISTVDLNNLSKLTQQFEYFIKFMAKNKIIQKSSEVKNNVQNKISKANDRAIDNNYLLDNMPLSFAVKASNKKIIESDANKHTVSDISQLLFFNDQLKKSIAQTNETYPVRYPLVPVIYGLPNYNQQFYRIPGLTVTTTTNRPTTTSNDIIIKPQDINNVEKTLSKDLIGMIAENVKAIVLKDLHQGITSTTSVHTNPPSNHTPTATETSAAITFTITTTSPTVAVTTQKPLENKSSEATQVLRSIMDLFKEFKALKDKTASTVTPHTTLKYDNENFYNPLANLNNLFMQLVNPQQRNMKITQELAKAPFNPYQPQSVIEFRAPTNLARIERIEMVNPQNKKITQELAKVPYNPYQPQSVMEFRSPTNTARMESIDNNNIFRFPVQNMKGSEIIQTNSGEIAPLSIPLSKPLRFIHQNIVVTTAPPSAEILYSGEWPSNYYEKPNNRDEARNVGGKIERYRYSTHFENNSTPSNRERTHARYSSNLKQQEPSLFQYKPYTSHRESNYSKYNTNIFHRDKEIDSRSPYRSNSRIQHNSKSKPSDRDYLKQYDSNQFKSNSYPTKFDLLSDRYSTRIPQFRLPLDNNRYDVRDRGHSYAEGSRISNSGRNDYRLGYTPRYEMSMLSKIENGFIEAKNRESNKSVGGNGVRKPDAERFHERLERVDAWRDENKANLKEMEKCCDDLALASRQQLALNTMKTKYDDTHFKNFLKTQQKVNDMLEKMLTSKTSEPRSVEII